MKKLLPILALLALMLVPWTSRAQSVTIGTGTSTQNSAPVANYYNYSLAEMIFTAEEIAAGSPTVNTIVSVGFECTADVNKEYGITIYMKNVDADAFTAASDYVALTAEDVIYTGTLTPTSGWTTIDLDAPFTYDNTQNLLIAVNKTSGGYSGSTAIWKYTSTSSTYRMLWKQSDGSAYDPTTSPSLDPNYNRPNVQLTFGTPSACSKPTNIQVSDITSDGATISWTPNSNETQWQITLNEQVVGLAQDAPTYTLTGLEPNTAYTVGVAAVCSADDITAAATATFRTGFAGQYVTLADSTATNQYIPIYGIYVDEAQHNQIVYPASMMQELLGNDLTGFVFYMGTTSTTNWNTTVTVSLGMSADETLSALSDANVTQVWQGTVSGMEQMWSITFDEAWRYTGGNLLVDITTTVGTYKSASFYGVSAASGSSICTYSSSQKPSFLPKVTMFYEVNDSPLCLMPGNLQASATTNSIELSWTAGGSETLWEVLLDDEPVAQTTETAYTITDLSALTQYSVGVRSVCGNDYSNTNSTTVTTTAEGGMCTFTADLSGSLYTSSYYTGAIELYQNDVLMGSLTSSNSSVEVYSAFPVELRHYSTSTYGSGTAIVYNGAGEEVFNGSVNASNLSNGDVIATAEVPCPTCFVPTALEVSNLSDHGFTLSWQPGGDESAWQIILATAAGDSAVYYAQTNSYTFSQLADNTEYTASVRSDCGNDGNDGMSSAATITATTPVAGFEPATVPYDCGFGPNDDVAFWQYINGANNIWVVNNDQLYIAKSGDTSLANSYNTSGTNVSYAMRQLDIEEGGLYYVQFDYMGQGESSYDYLRAWIAPVSIELTADKLPNGNTSTNSYTSTTPAGWQDLGGKMNQKSEWTHVAQGVELEAGSYNIVFMWCNDVSGGTQPPAAVDNLSIYQVNEISINAHSNDEEMGYVEGGSLYAYGETVTLTAVPATDNYYFTHWSTGDTTATITITADLTAQSTEYIAYFEANVASIVAYTHNQTGGTVEGSGEYANGDTATLTATADDGWHFSRWSDGNTDNPRTIVASVNMELEAYFVHSYDMSEGSLYIDFDEVDGTEYFDMSNGGLTNQWAIGQTNEATHMNNALIISDDGGQTNAYTQGQAAAVFAWVNASLEAGLYDFSYDWKNQGSYNHYMRACLVPASMTTEAATWNSSWSSYSLPTGAISIDSSKSLYNNTSWRTMSGSFELTEAGDYKLVFYWTNNGTVYTDITTPPAIDNIYLYHNTEPIGLTAYGDQQRGWVETDEGEYYYGDTATLVAVPGDGYLFDHWSTGETTDTITFQVNINTMYTEYVAYFVSANPTLTVYYSPNLGNVTGINADNNSVTVAKGESVTIEAIPNEGFYFSNWSDGNTDNPRTIVMDDDITLECNFLQPLEELYVDFETSDGGVILKNGDRTNRWTVGITSADGGNSGLYITNDGENNAYTNNSSASVFAYFPMMLNPGIYAYSFDWMCNGESTYDFLRVALVPASIEFNAGTSASGWTTSAVPSGAIALDGGSMLNQQTTVQTQDGEVEVTEQGLYNLVFYWRNDGSQGSNPPASIDNINFYNTHPYYGINAYVTDYEGNYAQFGYVEGAGEAEYGTTVTLTPMPTDTAYHFLQWSDGDTNLTREVVAMPGIEDEEFVAVFVPNYITLTVYKSENVTLQSAGGYTFESNMQYQVEGGKNLILNASTEMRYRPSITAYDASGEQIYHEVSDSNMLSVQLFTVTDIQISAGTWENKRTIRVFASDPTVATALGSGYYFYGDTVTMMVAPKRGYQFAGWEDAPELDNMREVVVTDNADYTALVEPIICLPDTEFVHDTTVVFDTLTVTEVDTLVVTETVIDTVIETQIDTVYQTMVDTLYQTMIDTVYQTVIETQIDTVYQTVIDIDTVYQTVIDTVIETQIDTVYQTMIDTVVNTEFVHDTTVVTETVFDTVTLTEYINVPVHDTMYVNRYIYDSVYFYDTTFVHDTTTIYQWRIDTTYVTVNDSIIQTLVDTMYVYVNDTTQIYNFVHDTTYINIHDTTYVTNYDTLTVTNTIYNTDTVILNNFIHDTTVVTEVVVDTAYVPVHDTTYVDVHDTTTLVLHDTMYVYRYTHDTLTFYDTTFVHDTTTVYQWRIDTTYVTVNDSIIETLVDTMYVYVNDTTQIYNFVHDTTYIYIHDTTMLTLYDTLTVTNTIVDSVILNNYIHDTTVVTETVFDTVTEYITDTVDNYIYDTVNVTEYITDTVTEYITDTVTEYVTDTVDNYIYDTVNVTEYITDTVTEYVTDTVDNYIYDTTLVTDTLWLTDTVYITLTDTVYIHDTVYVGIGDDATMANVKLYQRDGQIIVEGAEGSRVMLFDAVGRQLATKTNEYDVLTFDVPSTGAYLIKVGNAPARRIVVVR